jgi:hypothetical protein
MALFLIGEEDAPRWANLIQYGPAIGTSSPNKGGRYCCEDGHYTPEAAASHGAELAATLMTQEVRALKPPHAGALALQQAA